MSFISTEMSFRTVLPYSSKKDMSSLLHDMFSAAAYLSSNIKDMSLRTGSLSLQAFYMASPAVHMSSGPADIVEHAVEPASGTNV